MPHNALSAISRIAAFHNNNLKAYSSTYLIRINAVGEQLEYYIKDALSDSFELRQDQKEVNYSKVFSYLGNQNNPPDVILRGSDAFEIKKIENPTSSLALNSSPPKDRLHSSDPRLTDHCRNCESPQQWREKDLFYVVGHAKNGLLRYLLFVHALCYAAQKEVYERVHEPLKAEITSILNSRGLEIGETVELGKVKKVDPLGITELRIRGMWSIQNPIRVFSRLFTLETKSFALFALMKKSKYEGFPAEDTKTIEDNGSIKIQDATVKDPNNPAKTLDAKVIRLEW